MITPRQLRMATQMELGLRHDLRAPTAIFGAARAGNRWAIGRCQSRPNGYTRVFFVQQLSSRPRNIRHDAWHSYVYLDIKGTI